MVSTLCLLACAAAAAQQGSPDATPGPRLSRGQELVYTGSYTEEGTGKAVHFIRQYRLEGRVLVLDAGARGLDVALFTILRPRHPARARGAAGEEPASVRLEAAHVSPRGHVEAAGPTSLTVPLDGPALVECGAFVEWPAGRVAPSRSWETSGDGRPPRTWRVTGHETIAGTRCVRLESVQQSDDWDEPRADRTAWRRRDVLWALPTLGVAARVERTVERREPARREPSWRCDTTFELESQVVYPGRLLEDREREISQFRTLAEALAAGLGRPDAAGAWDAALARIASHTDLQPATPYREALVQLRRRLEAARRGDAALPEAPDAPATPSATVGQPAPDFVAAALTGSESLRSKKLAGRPALLLFYSPGGKTSQETLRFAQSVQQSRGGALRVVSLAVTDDTERALREYRALGLTIPVYSGVGLGAAYGVEATPRWVVLDAAGIVRAACTGWGREIPGLIAEVLKQNEEQTPGKAQGQSRGGLVPAGGQDPGR